MAWGSRTKRFLSYRERHSLRRRIFKALGLIATTMISYHLLTTYLLSTYRIESVSMQQQFSPGDMVLASPAAYALRLPILGLTVLRPSEPRRGDLVLVRPPYAPRRGFFERLIDPLVRFLTFQQVSLRAAEPWQQDFVLRRLIAVPGDTVRMHGFEAYIRPNGASDFIPESALLNTRHSPITTPQPAGWSADLPFSGVMSELTLGEGEYFVLGDNRPLCLDSRHWGPLTERNIHARVLTRYWSTRAR